MSKTVHSIIVKIYLMITVALYILAKLLRKSTPLFVSIDRNTDIENVTNTNKFIASVLHGFKE